MIKRVLAWGIALSLVLFRDDKPCGTRRTTTTWCSFSIRWDDMMAASANSHPLRSHVVSAILLLGAARGSYRSPLSRRSRPYCEAGGRHVLSPYVGMAGDLAMHDIDGDRRVNFLGALGAAFLVLGFVIQFAGTLLSLSIRTAWAVPMILLVSSITPDRVGVTSSRDHGGPRRAPTSWRRSRTTAPTGDEYVVDHDGRGARRRSVSIISGRATDGYPFGVSFFRLRAEARSRCRSSASRSR